MQQANIFTKNEEKDLEHNGVESYPMIGFLRMRLLARTQDSIAQKLKTKSVLTDDSN